MKPIEAYKNNRLILVQPPGWHAFQKPKLYDRLPPERIFGFDTESFQSRQYGAMKDATGEYHDGLRTEMVQLDFVDPQQNVILDTLHVEYPIEALFDHLWPHFSEYEDNPSRTKQRTRRDREDGDKPHRDGRRQYIEPIVGICHSLEYDLGRLIRDHPQFKRVIQTEMDSVRVQVGSYEVEIAHLIPKGPAPCFEFYVRKDHRVMRLIGRDTFGYLKMTLAAAAKYFLDGREKVDIDTSWFNRLWEDFTPDELDKLKEYAKEDPRIARELYEALFVLLTNIEKSVVCRNGILPPSAPGAAAKMAFSMAEVDNWPRPSRYVTQIGAWSCSGPRLIDPPRPGYYEHLFMHDVCSSHAHVLSLLPDPATCEYVDIGPRKYRQRDWRGKWGCMLVSGISTDARYPAIRQHNLETGRLEYVVGKFTKVWVTIPEVVTGVESKRLHISEIHEGVEIVGSNEHSFLKKFVDKVFGIKNTSKKGSPMYLIAKLLLNSLYGKLLEVILQECHVDGNSRDIQLPDVPGIEEEFSYLEEAYVVGGFNGLDAAAHGLWMEHKDSMPDTDEYIRFGDLVDRHRAISGKAGAYYLPMHGAQVTGFASAKLGLAAACTGALIGHTDSITTIGPCKEGFEQYREIMQRAGYDAPTSDLGSFQTEIEEAHGWLAKGNLYALKYQGRDGQTEERIAHHGIVNYDHKLSKYDLIAQYIEDGKVTYRTKPHPMPLKQALALGKEPGEFFSEPVTLTETPNPHMTLDSEGNRVWAPTLQKESAMDLKLRRLHRENDFELKNSLLREHGYVWRKDGPSWVLIDTSTEEIVTEQDAMNRILFLQFLSSA